MKSEKEIKRQLKRSKSRYDNIVRNPIDNIKKWQTLVKLSLKINILTWILE